MKSLSIFATVAAGGAWILWELRPSSYRHFVDVSYDQPYFVFGFESLVAVTIASLLLLGVMALQRGSRNVLVPWSANRLVRAQLVVLSCAAITGVYGIRQIFQMNSMLGGNWGGGEGSWFGPNLVVALALSPWIVFLATAVVSAVAAKVAGLITAAILLFDLVCTTYLAFIFVHLGHWACLTCSGPAM